jgi:hypothetical protein
MHFNSQKYWGYMFLSAGIAFFGMDNWRWGFGLVCMIIGSLLLSLEKK